MKRPIVVTDQRKSAQRRIPPSSGARIGGDRWFFDPPDRHFDIVEARIAFDAAPVAIVLCNLAGQIVQANRAFQEMFGLQSLCSSDSGHLASVCAAHFEVGFIDGLARDGVLREVQLHDRAPERRSDTVLCTASRIAGEEGMPRWLLVVFSALHDAHDGNAANGDSMDKWSDAQQVAGIGYWRLDAHAEAGIVSSEMSWSEGMFSLLDATPTCVPRTLKHWLAAIAPADRALIVTGLRDLAVRGGEYDIEYRRQARDGSRSTIHSRARSIGPVSASGVFALTGVEQRVDAQSGGDERLAGVMKAIIDSNDCPVYAVDSALRLLCSNGAFRTMLGHNQERALATLADCVLLAPHSWPWQKVLENVRRALRGERRIEETQVHDVSGLELWYDMTYNPVLSPDGEVAGVAVSGVNVTARKITGNRQPEPVGPMLPIADPTADL